MKTTEVMIEDGNKSYLKKDFFMDEKGNGLFEGKKSGSAKHVCVTDTAEEKLVINEGCKSIYQSSITELVIGLGPEIPLWKKNVSLKWRFNPMFEGYENSIEVKNYIRTLFNTAINKWGDASPVAFQESRDEWDFEIIIRPDNCNNGACTLASAFFPNLNQNILTLHPEMFRQESKEQVDTLIHEMGHIFGLRHYFAKARESSWRSEIFGVHYPLTIMNYGHNSELTDQDKKDLKMLYTKVWSGALKDINGLPIKQYNCFTQI